MAGAGDNKRGSGGRVWRVGWGVLFRAGAAPPVGLPLAGEARYCGRLMTRFCTALLFLASFATLNLTGCAGEDGGDDVDAILALNGVVASGATVYDAQCKVCHGADGAGGGSFPSLVAMVPGQGDEEIVSIVLEGEAAMPEFRSKLSDQEVADLLAYLRETFK